jgi:uncharacterized NAD(P)/FAD-binding protein YdhS
VQLTTERDKETVAIVGGGCAGILVAAHLMRTPSSPARIVIFEPRAELGSGAAYSTDEPRHLLNAPACGMSAFEDDPGHFVRWLVTRALPYAETDFVPRFWYRQYLQDVLNDAVRLAAPGSEVVWIHELVTSISQENIGDRSVTSVGFGQGQRCHADAVVLATGAPAPVALPALDVSPTFGMIRDPWCVGALDTVATAGDVLILGTGLTMIDIAMVLTDRDRARTVHARSRHGLLPAEHASDGFAPWPGFDIGTPTAAREVLHRLRHMTAEAESEGWNWRNVIAAARTAAPVVWGGLPEAERQRVLRHLGRRWEVSRHRMSTPVAHAVDGLRCSGRLTVGAGRVVGVQNDGSVGEPRLRVTLTTPGGGSETLAVSALIDCTGPGPDPTVGSPVIAGLVATGLARIHCSGIGLDIDEHGQLRTRSGRPGTIATVGWCRRGEEFEATAVPELRRQADRLARHMTETFKRRLPELVAS